MQTLDYKGCKVLQSKSLEAKLKYLNFKNKLTKIIRVSEKMYYDEKFNKLKGNIRETWKFINNILQEITSLSKQSSIKEIVSEAKHIKDSFEIASTFNNFFVNIGPPFANKIIPESSNLISVRDTMPAPNLSFFFLEPCATQEVTTVVRNLSNNDGVGVDGYSIKILKPVIPILANQLRSIFNKSLVTRVFPNCLKHAKVIPIYKADDKLLVSNYRPVSILPVFSKVFEKLRH